MSDPLVLTARRVIRLRVDLNIDAVPEAFAVNLDKLPVLKENNFYYKKYFIKS